MKCWHWSQFFFKNDKCENVESKISGVHEALVSQHGIRIQIAEHISM